VERVIVIAELVWSGHLLLPPTARRDEQARRDSGASSYRQSADAGDEVHWFAENEVGHAGKSEQKSTNRVGNDEGTAAHDASPVTPFRPVDGVAARRKQSLREPLLPADGTMTKLSWRGVFALKSYRLRSVRTICRI
jgi:hypothetical protein